MKVTQITAGLSRTVNLGNFESCRFELSVTVEPDNLRPLTEQVKEAYAEVARLITEERTKRLKTPDNVVSIEERMNGAVVRAGKPVMD